MKKVIIKSTLAVVAVATSCLGAWRAYDAYGNVDNSMLMENLEALAQDEGGDAGGDNWLQKLVSGCYDTAALLKNVQCLESETNAGFNVGGGVNIPFPTEGGTIPVGGNAEVGSNYNHTTYSNKSKWVCQESTVTLLGKEYPNIANHCDRREQTDCDGNKCGDKCCG